MALAAERDTPRREHEILDAPVAAGAKIFKGALVVLDAGYARPGTVAAGLIAAGRAEESVDNTSGSAGAKRVRVRRGTFMFKNHGADPVVAADLGATCYVVDDETVAKTSATNTRSAAGRVEAVETGGVWVRIA